MYYTAILIDHVTGIAYFSVFSSRTKGYGKLSIGVSVPRVKVTGVLIFTRHSSYCFSAS